ncbi:MAG: murein biosynthesis integral membrane protein MurJ [Candidatus Lambdaproteobacteria bacterium]|nr:murein biosynthesis integral membrane protein MurJ [Candidatus Lambdaproteobacteria bacterium]
MAHHRPLSLRGAWRAPLRAPPCLPRPIPRSVAVYPAAPPIPVPTPSAADPPPTSSADRAGAAVPGSAHTSEGEAIYGHAGVVTFFTLLSRLLGMVRDLVVAHRFGASGATDAWVQAFRVPNALRRLTAEGSMTIAFIPIYVRVRERSGPAEAHGFARRVLGLVLAATLLLTGLGMAFSHQLTVWFSPGFIAEPVKFELTVWLTRWTFPYLVLVSAVAWAMGILNAERRFVAPAAAPILLNLGIIAAVLGFSGWAAEPVRVIAWGVLAGGAAQVALQVPSLLAAGLPLLPRLGWADARVRELFRLLLPSLFGVAVYQLNIVILGVIASYLPTGQIFHYYNGTRLTELALGLFTFAFTTAGFPTLSEHQARQEWSRMAETVRLTCAAVLYTTLPAMAGLIAAAPAIVAMLYLHGAFTAADVASTVTTLQLMALGLPTIAGTRVLVPVFYAFGDARTPVLVSAATLVVTCTLGWWLSLRWQVQGLALGLSAGTWFQYGALAWALQRRRRLPAPWFPWRSCGLQALAALAVAGVAYAIGGLGAWSRGALLGWNWLVLGALLAASVGVYLGITLLLREPQAGYWVKLAARVLRRFRR